MSTGRFKLRKGVYPQAQVKQNPNGSLDLVLPEKTQEELLEQLPNVTVITITRNRGEFAGVMLYNWTRIKYPREKLEWLILDDTDPDYPYQLVDYIPQDDPVIRFVKLKEWLPVAEKRNKAVELAKYDYIVHMDDDDYYFPDHVLVKMRLMIHYNVDGVHSAPIGVYDMMENSSYIFDWGGKNGNTNDTAEASMAYKKSYWQSNKFATQPGTKAGEGRPFIHKHFNRWLNVHFFFNIISITHSSNITGHNRRMLNENKDRVKTGDFMDVFPQDFKTILGNVKKILDNKYVKPTTWR